MAIIHGFLTLGDIAVCYRKSRAYLNLAAKFVVIPSHLSRGRMEHPAREEVKVLVIHAAINSISAARC